MTFTIEIQMDNAAFEDGGGVEVANILRELAGRIDGVTLREGNSFRLSDTNGNRVGEAMVA